MDPNDDSITGTVKYLVYRRRKQLEFHKDMAMLQYSTRDGLDPTEAVENFIKDFFPQDIKEQIISDVLSNKNIELEAKKSFKVKKGPDGILRLKVE